MSVFSKLVAKVLRGELPQQDLFRDVNGTAYLRATGIELVSDAGGIAQVFLVSGVTRIQEISISHTLCLEPGSSLNINFDQQILLEVKLEN